MNLKHYFLAGLLSIIAALLLTLLLWLFSLIGWWTIGGILAFLLIPVAMKTIQFYNDTDCMDLSDFWIELNDYIEEKNNSRSKQNRIE
jgi:hypothetical protein